MFQQVINNVKNYDGDVLQSAGVDSSGMIRVYLHYPDCQATQEFNNKKILTHIKADKLVMLGSYQYSYHEGEIHTTEEILGVLKNKVSLGGIFDFTDRGTARMKEGNVSLD